MALLDTNRWRIQDVNIQNRIVEQAEDNEWTLQSYTTTIDAQRFEGSFTTVPLLPEEANALIAWLNVNRKFDVQLPTLSKNACNPQGSPTIRAANLAGNKQLRLTNCPASVTGYLTLGSRIAHGAHSKVYQVAADVNTDASGNCDVPLASPLLATSVVGNAALVQNVPFYLYRVGRVLSYKRSATGSDRVKVEVNVKEYF